MHVRILSLLLLPFACGDAAGDTQGGSSSTGEVVNFVGLGELCQAEPSLEGATATRAGICKNGLVCGAIALDCDLGICLSECVQPTEDDLVPGDPGCPTLNGEPSYCLLTSGLSVPQPGCGWLCGGPKYGDCPSGLAQSLVCESICRVPSSLCTPITDLTEGDP